MVPVNTVPVCIVVAVVGERLFGLFTRIARMSERPQLGYSGSFRRPESGTMTGRI